MLSDKFMRTKRGSSNRCVSRSFAMLDADGETTIPPGWNTNITAVSAGFTHICAITSSGGLNCWGSYYREYSSQPV